MGRTSWRLEEPEPEAIVASTLPLQGYSAKANGDVLKRELDYVLNGQQKGWQNYAWHYYETIGELQSIARYVANMLSKFNLYAAKATADPFNPERLPDTHPASLAVERFAGGFLGQSQLLAEMALHYTIAGECVVAGPWDMRKRASFPFDRWRAYSSRDITSRNGQLFYKKVNQREERLPPSVAAFRAWRGSPVSVWEASSPTKGALEILREISLLDAHVKSSATSRLSGAGLLLIPDEVTIPTGDVEVDGQEVDPLIRYLAEVMSIAMKNPNSAAAKVPVMMRGPGEALEKLKWMTFETPFSEAVPELRTGALRRLGLAMDIPPEILTGTSEGTGWSAWQTMTQAVTMHGIPLCQAMVYDLTEGWLKPFMARQRGVAQEDDILIWFDTANLRVRPNEAEETTAAFDRFEADADALRLVTGLSPEARPTNEELARQILLHLVRENPSMAGYAVNALRENFGVKDLPLFEEKIEAVQIAQRTTKDEEFGTDVVPGERSVAKQPGIPATAPDADGDDADNEQGRP